MKWALVLSGGGGRGLTYIGVFKKLKSMGLKPDFIAGTSIGAILGGLYAAGMDPDDMEDFLLNGFNIKKYVGGLAFKLNSNPIGKLIMAETAINSILLQPGLESGERIRTLLNKLSGITTFEETEIPFMCNGCDLLTGKNIILNKGNLADAIYASMAYPGVFEPIKIDDYYLSDGGINNNLLIRETRQLGYHRILALNSSLLETVSAEQLSTGFHVILRSMTIGGKSTFHKKLPPFTKSHTIDLRTGDNGVDFTRIGEFIKIGEDAFDAHIKQILKITGKPPKALNEDKE